MSPALCALLAVFAAPVRPAGDPPDVFSADLARFSALARAPRADLRIAAARGLAGLAHPAAQPALLRLLEDFEGEVRAEAAFGLGRCGTFEALEPLAQALGDPDPRVAAQALASLERLTGWSPAHRGRRPAGAWLEEIRRRFGPGYAGRWRACLRDPAQRITALKEAALKPPAGAEEELLDAARSERLSAREVRLLARALERCGGGKAIDVLARGVPRIPEAAWALGEIGGPRAEAALLEGLRRAGRPVPAVLYNLDRLHSRALFPFAPILLFSFGLVSYRSLPDDLHQEPTALQRTAANLLLRTGRAEEIADLLLRKLEGKPLPRAGEVSSEIRALVEVLDRMDPELKPGFHRADGFAHLQPLGALPHLVRNPAFEPRLVALLDHPALVARVYVATALARLGTPGAARAIVPRLLEPYPFPDAATQVSGKHGPVISGRVRWRGYLAMALGWCRDDFARRTLEELVCDPARPRDVRFGAAVGLGRLADPRSRKALECARERDVVWWIREEARRSLERIEIAEILRGNGRTR